MKSYSENRNLIFIILFVFVFIAIVKYFNLVLRTDLAMIGYFAIIIIGFLFLKYPYYGLLGAFLLKPIIDIFWFTKTQGLISPLFIAGVLIPFLAIINRKRVIISNTKSHSDKIIISYLVIFGVLTALKIINAPIYMTNSIDSYVRILSVTAFYFIGKYYFTDERKVKQLIWVVILSFAAPFLITVIQMLVGENLHLFTEATPKTLRESEFYVGGRHNLIRISGAYAGIYELAFFGLIVTLLLFAIKVSKERFPFWGYTMLPLGVFFLYFTYSRSAWSLFLVSLMLFSICRKKLSHVFLIICGACILYITIPNVQYRYEDELGFLLGKSEFYKVGYSRGGLWIRLIHGFMNQDIVAKMIGNYGLGNPENQFLGIMFWFGYIGLVTFVLVIVFLTVALWKKRKYIENNNSFKSNTKYMFISMLIGSYWFAGLGNQFTTMITVQWILWTWTGILLNNDNNIIEKSQV